MNRVLRRTLTAGISGILSTVLVLPGVSAGSSKEHKYRYSEIDMPVSLAVGSVRTPEFHVKQEAYFIMIQAERRLPYLDMKCMMGLTSGPLDAERCKNANEEPLLQADWAVWEDGKMVDKGSIPNRCACEFTNKYLFKFLGTFLGEHGKRYVVEVKFTKDGTPLNVTNPHLIVISVRNH